MAKSVKLEQIDANEKIRLFTIIFGNDDLSEFAKFITKFKENGKLRRS